MAMFDMNDILTALQSGQTDADALAKDFTTALNSALAEQKRIDQEKKAAEVAKRDKLQKRAEADEIATMLIDFAMKYYPDFFEEDMFGQMNGQILIEVMDAVYEALKPLMQLKEFLAQKNPEVEVDVKIDTIAKPAAEDNCGCGRKTNDPLTDFLKANGLI